MKKQLITFGSVCFAMAGAPAFAEDDLWTDGWQVSVGGAFNKQGDIKSHMIQGRLRKEFGDFLAVEGEAAFAVAQEKIGNIKTGLDHEFGGFAVLKTPEMNGFEVFGRAGYASTRYSVEVANAKVSNTDGGFAYGGGAQYFFDDANGVRLDFTRFDRTGTDMNLISIAYTRKF